VVLAAGAHAFLRRDRAAVGPLLKPGEDVLELHHAGIGEHQGRIVARHQRAGSDDLMPVAGKIVEEGRPYLVDAAHAISLLRWSAPGWKRGLRGTGKEIQDRLLASRHAAVQKGHAS